MKRIISMILALIMCISIVPAVFADNSATTVKSAYEEFLENMNILDFEFDGETKIDRKLFSYLICKITNSQSLSDEIWEFNDVDDRCRFNTEIECVTGFGWMKADLSGNFNPHNPVSMNDAALAFVKMLGYGPHADNSGGYPNGYLSMANRLGITDGIKIENLDALTMDEIYGMTYNFLHSKVIRRYIYGTENASYTETPEISALEYYLNIKYKGGILEENYVTALTGDASVGEGRVKIGGETFMCDEVSYRDLLGYYVNCYYKPDEPQTAIYIYAHHKKNSEITVYGKDVTNVNITSEKTVITYETENNKEKEVRLSGIGDVIYNGKAYLNYPKSCFEGDNTVIKLIDNTDDRIYDVAVVYCYETTVVDSVSATSKIITDKYDSKYNLNLSDKKNVIYEIYRDGAKIDVGDLTEWDVLSVAKSTDGTYYKIHSERRSITGKIDMISDDGRSKIFVVDGVSYDVSPDIREKYASGEECNFYFDFWGRIAALKITDYNQKLYGYILDAGTSTQKLETQHKIKLLTEKGEVKIYTLREKVDFNGTVTDDKDVISSPLIVSQGEAVMQLVIYTVNAKDEITYLNTADAVAGEDYLTKNYELGNAYFTDYNYSFDSECFLDDDTLVFITPSTGDVNDESLYEIGNISTFIAYQRYNIVAYDYDDFNVAKVIVAKIDTSDKITTTTSLFLINSVISTLDENGNIVDGLRGVQNKMNVTFNLKSGVSADGYKAGDIVRLALNSKNEICAIQTVVTDVEYDTIESKFGLSNTIMSSFLCAVGKVEKIKGTRLVLNTSANPASDALSAWNLSYSGINVYTYNTTSNTADLASVAEICVDDILIMRSRSGRVHDVFIIK
ncbi:MAG: hypothetical protein IJC74_09395 [Clostridia bacterium]|nr:hypothetical protein [Clostridia bacterium]